MGDRSGEAFYLRDDDAGDLWGPIRAAYPRRRGDLHGPPRPRLQPIRACRARDRVRSFQYVPVDNSIKISRLVLTNQSSRPRRLSVTAYVEWTLGPSRSASLPFVSTELDAATGAIFARNAWNMGFGSRVAFADLRGAQSDWTGDRRESSAVTARWPIRPPLPAFRRYRRSSAPGSILVRRCARRSNCRRAAASKSSSCLAKRQTRTKRAR